MANDEELGGSEEEVWNAIIACEQIVEAMPTDRHSLRTLSNAYEQVGDLVKSQEYMIRLAEVVLAEQDAAAAVDIQKRLTKFSGDESVLELIASLRALSPADALAEADDVSVPLHDLEIVADSPAPGKDAAPASSRSRSSTKTRRIRTASTAPVTGVNLTEEIALAWSLHEDDVFDEEEYSDIVEDLTRLSGGDTELTISVFHVLGDRQSPKLEKALTTAAAAHGTPIIALSSFAIARETAQLLSTEFMIRRGVIPYEVMGNRVLVAIMNPLDKQLRKDVEQAIGLDCFFYLVAPAEFDEALTQIRETLERDPGDDD
ncbi:MAG: hypothetical protein O2923_11675 [Verrucomicrobia bacterium]|nr:hypothetical protein [Verrucomicrobiota bacterium]MDA1086210.1 hypothetical protein [Verrucomicrobiota bacterium]